MFLRCSDPFPGALAPSESWMGCFMWRLTWQVIASLLIIQQVANKSSSTRDTLVRRSTAPLKPRDQGELTDDSGGHHTSSMSKCRMTSNQVGVGVEAMVNIHQERVWGLPKSDVAYSSCSLPWQNPSHLLWAHCHALPSPFACIYLNITSCLCISLPFCHAPGIFHLSLYLLSTSSRLTQDIPQEKTRQPVLLEAHEEIQRLQSGLSNYSALFPSQSNTSLSSEPMGPSSIVTHSTIRFARRIRSFISRAARWRRTWSCQYLRKAETTRSMGRNSVGSQFVIKNKYIDFQHYMVWILLELTESSLCDTSGNGGCSHLARWGPSCWAG